MTEINTWRLIKNEAMSGAQNMAIDESILEAVSAGIAPPTLRLYAWSPPYVSLGYAQPYEDLAIERIRSRNWSVVRRPTGGRAILHTDELTYSVIAPSDHPDLTGGVIASYQRLSQALLRSLINIGLKVTVSPEVQLSEQERVNPVCFEVPSSYEIEVAGRKLLGSAQVRRRNGVLQHGTLPLTGDITRICDALRYENEDARRSAKDRVRSRAASVSELLGTQISWERAADAMIRGFEDVLDWRLEETSLSNAELDRAADLKTIRYANSEWNQRV
jgi:lipoate-protein ligase A